MAEIPQIVAQRLRRAVKPGDHLDPNLLTAFLEKSLGKHEHIQVLEHLSACADCREIISLSTTPPEIAGVVPLPAARPAWLAWPVLRWGAAVACIVVVGAVVTLRQESAVKQIAKSEIGPVTRQFAQPSSNSVTALSGSESAAKPSAPSSGLQASGTASTAARIVRPQEAKTARPADDISGVTASAPVEMADARADSQFTEMVPGRAKDAPTEPQVDRTEKAVSMAASPKKRSMAAGVGAFASGAALAENLSPRWTLSSDGTLQRSLDSGRSWQTIPISKQTTFRALAANGLDIWVGGSAGALYHSSDAGQHWSQVRPVVNGEVLADDVIGVEFTDIMHGKLTTSNDEVWSTADAGQTWQKQ